MSGAILMLLGFVFALAGASKLLSPDPFRATLRKLIVPGAVPIATVGIPALELVLALWLLSGAAPREAAAAAIVVLLAFCAVLLRIWRKGLTCGCFGEAADSALSGLVRNAILIALAASVALPEATPDTPWSMGAGIVVGRITVVVGAACLWPCVVALADRRNRVFSTAGGAR